MAAEIEIVPDRNLVFVTIEGQMGIQDALQMFESYVTHPEFKAGMNVLMDLREAYITPSPDDIQSLAGHVRERLAARGTGYKVALVADAGIKRATAEVYQSLAQSMPMEVQVFNNEDTAYHWLEE